MTYLVVIICVIGIAAGQILFKLSALALQRSGSFFDPNTAMILCSAFILYGLTTIGWVWALQKADLGRLYPILALTFVLVPLGSYLVLGERFQPIYFFGVALIVVGIMITVRS
jgi:drug/metabolite transporter (DMT)-like permease